MNHYKKLLNLKTHERVLVFFLLLIILPILVWGLSREPLELRKRADEPTPTPENLDVTPTITTTPAASETPTSTPTATATPSPTNTPTQTSTTIVTRVRFAGVAGSQAEGANITLRFTNQLFDAITSPIRMTHIGEGIYKGMITVPHAMIPVAQGYSISVKGEKHIARKFCEMTGQTSLCVKPSDITINLPITETLTFDFTGMPLEPGDLPPQDGVVNSSDFTTLKTLMAKPCNELTANEKYTGDVDYNGCVNVRDAFLMRKTLESRYDEF